MEDNKQRKFGGETFFSKEYIEKDESPAKMEIYLKSVEKSRLLHEKDLEIRKRHNLI